MKRQLNINQLIILLFVMFIFTTSIFVAEAQTKKPTLAVKIGDRVEVNGISPYRGTITEIGDGKEHDKSCYRIKSDSDKNASSQGDWNCSWGVENFIFLLDANDEKLGDVYGAKPAQPSAENNQRGSKPGSSSNTPQQNQNKNSDEAGEFKVGDRVEVHLGSRWFPAMVTRGLENNWYKVVRDEFVGKGLPDEGYETGDIRALNDGSKAPVAPAMPAMRKPVKCPEQPNAKGGAIPLALAKQLIQCLWEEMSTERSIINFDLHSAQIGTPRPWQTRLGGGDIGTGVPGKTLVYPVKGTWTSKDFAPNGSSVSIAEREGVHNCYINAFNKWQCGMAESKDLKPLQTIYR